MSWRVFCSAPCGSRWPCVSTCGARRVGDQASWRVPCARSGAVEEQVALACIPCQRRGALELWARLLEAAEFDEQIAAHAGQEVIGLERRLRRQLVDQLETSCWAECHPQRDRALQLHDG